MTEDCVFCKIVQNTIPAYKVYEDTEIVAFFDFFPVAKYHTLVIPKKHYADFFEIPSELLGKLMEVTQKIALVYRDSLGIENVQLLNNCGRFAQQGVFHIHFHIIPRFENDGNNLKLQKHLEYQQEYAEMINKLPRIE